MTRTIRNDKIKLKKTIIERMLILWQDQAEAVAHAEAEASVEDPLVVHTVAASEAHIMVAHSEVTTVVILADITTIITVRSFGDQDAVYMLAEDSVAVALPLLL